MHKSYGSPQFYASGLGYTKQNKTFVCMSHILVSNHAPKKQIIYDKYIIRMSRCKSMDYPYSHIVNQTITMMDKVFSWPTWLEVQMECIEVHYVEACKRARAKGIMHLVIQRFRVTSFKPSIFVQILHSSSLSQNSSDHSSADLSSKRTLFEAYIFSLKSFKLLL